jgi:hypothetical protein
MVDAGWGDMEVPEEQLYDLILDPGEARNLAGSTAHADVVADLRGRLEAWMRDTDDPLLEGPVAPPAGAEINLPEQGSSREPRVFVAEDGSLVDEPPALTAEMVEMSEAEAVEGQIR